jgi:vacuolar-type H+-ATPase subunit I/STV1
MVKEYKFFKQTEIVITILVGFLAVIIAVMMVLLQELYRLFSPSPVSIIVQLIISVVVYLFIIFCILKVMQKRFGKKK